jgi:hypothetical protein
MSSAVRFDQVYLLLKKCVLGGNGDSAPSLPRNLKRFLDRKEKERKMKKQIIKEIQKKKKGRK